METSASKTNQENSYAACDTDDTNYFGARQVVEAEKKYIRAHRGLQEEEELKDFTGLALSGGGIRSASFSLGIMQALAYRGWLKKIDYLSTVSGGGYIGSSLTWILENDPQFGMDKANFPYASYPMSGEARIGETRTPLSDRLNTVSAMFKGRMLRFLRQNAKYLTPGRGINFFSLVAVAIRGSFLGLLVYGGLLTLLFLMLTLLGVFKATPDIPFIPCVFHQNWFLLAMFIGLVLLAALIMLYAVGTLILSRWFLKRAYPVRRFYEKFSGYFLPVLLGLAVLGSLPWAHDTITRHGAKPAISTEHINIFGKQRTDGVITFNGEIRTVRSTFSRVSSAICPSSKFATPFSALFKNLKAEMKAVFAGLIAILVGFASTVGAFIKTNRIKVGRLPLGLFVSVGVIFLLFAILILGYSLARAMTDAPLTLLLIAATVLLVLAFANINHLSLHRFYRDRLMETFMPNMSEILEGRYEQSHKSSRANTLPLHITSARANIHEKNTRISPYHIINTNVVLASSNNAKYRGRGGDSFILSPAYCGCNATGWRQTRDYMNGDMTLASAMAISGAALNPSAGCGGEGITRSPFLSILMGLLNFRLGYWAPNPRERTGWRGMRIPNSFLPGLCEVAFRNTLNEHSTFLQLSDGGHFENLGLYELVRRRLKLIIVCDGGADPKFTFSDLANAIEKVRTDFGTLIAIEDGALDRLIPRAETNNNDLRSSDQAHLVAKIIYADNSTGRLVYITTTYFKQLSADLYGYKKEHPSFPDESTGDQFFDEKQFEAYRELGFQAAWAMMEDDLVKNDPILKSIM